MKPTPPSNGPGAHENDLFAKWRAARRDKLKRIAITEQQRDAAEHVRRTQ